ncbi:glycerol-3-phosphate 1-O-acyltransferase PlsY [Pararhizobium mangrovi]|uniref:Glycerol-3-phosphate acyltransferase n=1 Tax=Pararhizobium mangrovi TaxID=2590452 RepID=A0A506U2N4_9HYPH|nr:glycerol-3-phosphate 1-O-acyltransferase PlsY [Pararhizobium mangrovi]TPW26127.1 glycerol-3-phosphate 1-O-acyltransferase PlsY [Pararhizobium mangrovi]
MIGTGVWDAGPAGLFVALLAGYAIGSVPFGLLLTRLAGLGDVRTIGSGNIGATNVLRTGNKKIAAATLLCDALKGTIPAVLAHYLLGLDGGIAAGFGAFLGHLFPVWIGFRGGKGVATYIGVLLGLAPLGVPVFAVFWLGTAKLSRYSSLSALVAMVATTLFLFIVDRGSLALLFAVMTAISFFKHRTNITRLVSGTEGRIGEKG